MGGGLPAMDPANAISSAVLALAGALSVVLAAVAVDYLRAQRRSAHRLARFGLLGTPTSAAAPERPATMSELVRRLGAGLVKHLPPQQQQQLRAALVRAGLADRLALEEFLGLRALAVVLGAVVGAVLAVLAE